MKYVADDQLDASVLLAFDKTKADDRKDWLMRYDADNIIKQAEKSVSVSDFVNKEFDSLLTVRRIAVHTLHGGRLQAQPAQSRVRDVQKESERRSKGGAAVWSDRQRDGLPSRRAPTMPVSRHFSF